MAATVVDHGVDKTCPRINGQKVKLPSTVEQLRRMFWMYETNGDGKLSREELKEAFNYLGALVPRWRAYRELHYADENRDGYISGGEIDKLVNYAVKLSFVERHY